MYIFGQKIDDGEKEKARLKQVFKNHEYFNNRRAPGGKIEVFLRQKVPATYAKAIF